MSTSLIRNDPFHFHPYKMMLLVLLVWTLSPVSPTVSSAQAESIPSTTSTKGNLNGSSVTTGAVPVPILPSILISNVSSSDAEPNTMAELKQWNSSSSSLSQSLPRSDDDPAGVGRGSSKPKLSLPGIQNHRASHGKPTWRRPRREIVEVDGDGDGDGMRESQNETLIRRDRKTKLIANSHSMVMGPTGSGSGNGDLQRLRFGEHCECWNSSDGTNREVECSCTHLSPNMTLAKDVHRITVENSRTYTTLSNEHIRPFADSLLEIILSELPEFSQINDEAFVGMRNLSTIYIVGAPSLTNISHGVFKGFFPKLKNIKIVHTGLEVTPMLNQLFTNNHLDSLDLENNKISRIEPKWIDNVKVEHLSLSYNNLVSIGSSAFSGSTIARLTLEGNRELSELHSHTFVGIESLRQLDLSKTSITVLPTHGLKTLEILRVQRTPSLTVIPSIYHFESLKEAAMTYPYHCCAFHDPETHNPAEYKQFQEFVEQVKQDNCGKGTTPMTTLNGIVGGNEFASSSSSPPLESDSDSFILPQGNAMLSLSRSKRQAAVIRQRRQLFTGSITSRSLSVREAADGYGDGGLSTPEMESSSRSGSEYLGEDHNNEEMSSAWIPFRTSSSSSSSLSPFAAALSTNFTNTNPHPNPFSLHTHQSESGSGSGSETGSSSASVKSSDGFHDPYYTFDPDRTFTPLDNNQDEKHGQSWESDHGDRMDGLADDEFGTFHHGSVALPPNVIQLCGSVAVKRIPVVKCTPEPDAFSPCEDIMGNMWLRTAVWIVVTLALVGNAAVLIVLILTPGRMSVQRFLMANLSLADLCMGIYLMMVAVEDLVSLGAYFNFAIDWQLGWGCQLAGFLTVFAAELSVFTLAVITGERWYALTRAIHLTKRLTIKGAAKLMAVGWFLAINLALMPLIGVSSYSKTSICLPMEASTPVSQAYLAFMLLFNGIAFSMVAYAYYQMYQTVAGHSGGAPATHSADLAIAKKMGLLVFTDFVCWAPVAFFGLTAVGGYPLIGVTDAKILLVFFYPLNSFCNPYLYAILTKQYRRDLFLLLHRHGICANTMARFRAGAGGGSTNNTVPTMQTMMRLGSVTEGPRMSTRGSVSASVHLADNHNNIRPNYNNQLSTASNGNSHLKQNAGDPPLPLPLPLSRSLSGTKYPPDGIRDRDRDQRGDTVDVTSLLLNNSSSQGQGQNQHQHQINHSKSSKKPLTSNGQQGNSLHFSLDDGEMSDFDERILAETSFITLPSSSTNGANNRHRIPPSSTLPPIKDSIEEHEISEITPFTSSSSGREH